MQVTLAIALEEILTTITDGLRAATADGQPLAEVASVVRGDRERPRPELPALWVFAETATPQHAPRTLAEVWHLPVVITPIIKSDEPEEGYRLATQLAAEARSVVLKDRTLGLRDYVQDVRSGTFEASAPWHRRETLFSAVARVLVIFTIRE